MIAVRPARTALRGAHYVGEGVATFGAMLDFGRRAIFHSLFDIVLRQKYRTVVFGQISDVVTGAPPNVRLIQCPLISRSCSALNMFRRGTLTVGLLASNGGAP